MKEIREIKFRVLIELLESDLKTKKKLFHYFTAKEGLSKELQDLARGDVQQFTGLKDKHRIEIYEGDIVKVDWGGLAEDFLKGFDEPFEIEFRHCGWFPFAHALPTPDNIEIIVGNKSEQAK